MSEITKRLETLAAAQRSWCVTTTYADGSTRAHDTHGKKQAENWAIGERRKIGRDLINRTTGKTVRVVSVEITKL